MLYLDCFSLLGTDHGHRVLSVCKVVGTVAVHATFFDQVFRYISRFGIHGHQCIHLVATVNIKQLCCRPHTVCSIHITTELLVVLQAPVPLVRTPVIPQIMDVGSFCMKNLSEEALLCHIQGGEFKEVIDTVLQLHGMLLCFLGGIDDRPDLIERHGCRHLAGHMLALFHRIDHHGGMAFPVGGDIDQIDIVTFNQLLPGIVTSAVCSRARQTGLVED